MPKARVWRRRRSRGARRRRRRGSVCVTQIKLTKMHFQTRELVLASVAAFVTTPNLIIQWIEVG